MLIVHTPGCKFVLRQVVDGIHADSVDTHLKMQVVTCGSACGADIRYLLTLRYTLTGINMQIACMAINSNNTVIMLDHYAVAIVTVPLRERYCATVCCIDRGSVRG